MVVFTEGHQSKCIDGIWRDSGIIGYCYCTTHMGYLTTILLRRHQCLEKKCPFLKRNDEAPFWREYYLKEERKRYNKEKAHDRKQREILDSLYLENIKRIAMENTKDIPNMKVRNVMHYGCGVKIWYYSYGSLPIRKIEETLQTTIGHTVKMKRVDLSNKESIIALGDKYQPISKKAKHLHKLQIIAEHSRENQPDVIISEQCGCYYCMRLFSADEITDFVQGKFFATAVCPYCERQTILPEHPDYELTKSMLVEMNNCYF